MPRVNHRHDSVQHEFLAHPFIYEKSLRDGAGIGEPGGLQHDAIELVSTRDQITENADQVAAHGAADASVIHLENLFFGIDHQFLVDADFTELILDDGDALTVAVVEDAIQKRGLAGAQESGQYGHGNSIRLSHD